MNPAHERAVRLMLGDKESIASKQKPLPKHVIKYVEAAEEYLFRVKKMRGHEFPYETLVGIVLAATQGGEKEEGCIWDGVKAGADVIVNFNKAERNATFIAIEGEGDSRIVEVKIEDDAKDSRKVPISNAKPGKLAPAEAEG